MKDKLLSRALRIETDRAASAFADPLRRRLVLRLIEKEYSLAELARTMQIDIRRLHYHVLALTQLGLLTVSRQCRRAGRPIKMYRATSDTFFVPDSIADTTPTDSLLAQLRNELARQRLQSRSGVIYHLGENGEPCMRRIHSADGAAAQAREVCRVLRLSRADARQLGDDVAKIVAGYAGRYETSGTHVMYFALAPTQSSGPTKKMRPKPRGSS
jgi:DNA-binding transcriptional ArsR family regulator